MAKKLDPVIADTLKAHGFGPEAAWDCHGTWVVYHRVLEQIAAKARIIFDQPQVLEANGPAKSVALCVSGSLGDRAEWSVGEASPANNKNAYPYAMAEKRAKDRVILKLIGLHGLVYSEEEADDFKPNGTAVHPTSAPQHGEDADIHDGVKNWVAKEVAAIVACPTRPALYTWLEKVAGAGSTISDPDTGSVLDRLKRKAPEAYGEVVQAFQKRNMDFNRKDAA